MKKKYADKQTKHNCKQNNHWKRKLFQSRKIRGNKIETKRISSLVFQNWNKSPLFRHRVVSDLSPWLKKQTIFFLYSFHQFIIHTKEGVCSLTAFPLYQTKMIWSKALWDAVKFFDAWWKQKMFLNLRDYNSKNFLQERNLSMIIYNKIKIGNEEILITQTDVQLSQNSANLK